VEVKLPKLIQSLLTIAALLCLLNVQVSFAGPLEDGIKAAERGDFESARQLWEPLAEQGNANAQLLVGRLYERGEGVNQNYNEALKWYRLAAAQGNNFARLVVGSFYYAGRGVTKNYEEAFKWFLKAAEGGLPQAQSNLGVMLYFGIGVSANHRQALKWLRLAAEKGISEAQSKLGRMLRDGHGVARNSKEAMVWFARAAQQGFAEAQYYLGVMYSTGEGGVTVDNIQALMWLTLAAESGEDPVAEKAVTEISRKLKPGQIAHAKELAQRCRASNYKHCY
jgi:TPR repeat protein